MASWTERTLLRGMFVGFFPRQPAWRAAFVWLAPATLSEESLAIVHKNQGERRWGRGAGSTGGA
jgi:hypothetical protein